jgi:ketosteroid isomerase-like protein
MRNVRRVLVLLALSLLALDATGATGGTGAKLKDKSKPVRAGLEAWYQRNEAAFERRDLEAVMALRTENFHTVTPDGRTHSRADMETRTRGFLDRLERFLVQENTIGTIEVEGDLASADVSQHLVRLQRFPDGTIHTVETRVVQRESFRQTADGWKLYRVDRIRDGVTLVDGVQR